MRVGTAPKLTRHAAVLRPELNAIHVLHRAPNCHDALSLLTTNACATRWHNAWSYRDMPSAPRLESDAIRNDSIAQPALDKKRAPETGALAIR